ncbi:MAG: T9SS type A sorting domain-containing protein [Saprospiraceae bacterium]|nr:T9SS type A sorting domain-containing protein [Candidatus Opimibacter iunctus]
MSNLYNKVQSSFSRQGSLHVLLYAIFLATIPFSSHARTYYLNAAAGNDTFPGTSTQPWKTLSKSIAEAISGDSIFLMNGTYGAYIENIGTDSRNDWITYIAISGQTNVQFDHIRVTGMEANAYLHFEGIDIYYPSQPSCPSPGNAIDITSFTGVNFISLKNCRIHGENTYDSGGGVYFNHPLNAIVAVHDLVVDHCEIFQSATGIRFSGSKTTIIHCEIHHIHGTMIGNLCGPMSPTDLNAASNVVIDDNHLHDMHFYTSEPCYNTPGWSTAHASIIGIRGRDWVVRNNHIHDTWSPGIQLYGDDCGGSYDRANLLFENNLYYDNQGYQAFYNPGTSGGSHIGGAIIFRHNTFISGRQDSAWTYQDNPVNRFKASGHVQSLGLILSLPSENPYDGTGTVFEDNIFITETGIGNYNDQPFNATDAKWIMRNNLIYTKLWNCGNLDPTNYIITDNLTTGQAPADFIDSQLFEAVNYIKQHGLTHSPGSSFDLTPKPESIICQMSTTGGYVGAIPCDASSQAKDIDTSYSILVYPNPVTTSLTIRFADGNAMPDRSILRLTDPQGHIIHSSIVTDPESTIDMKHFAKGMYFLYIQAESQNIAVRKILIQ